MDYIKEAAYECRMPIKQLCEELGVSTALMRYYRQQNDFPPLLCAQIEKLTKGVVTRQMMRPKDYADIWPELGE